MERSSKSPSGQSRGEKESWKVVRKEFLGRIPQRPEALCSMEKKPVRARQGDMEGYRVTGTQEFSEE